MGSIDLVVVGGGHAGIEAARIAGIRGVRALLVTSHLDLIGQMSCNPSIGGIAKGNIVREIDALGGVMGRLIDRAGIHFRMLNSSKGSAVWGPRAQADKALYREYARAALEQCGKVSLHQGLARELRVRGDRVSGVVMDSGEEIPCSAVVLAMGTFLNGVIHIGMSSFPGGRSGEPPSTRLTESIQELGISSGRLKTGTSPRIDGRTVDLSAMTRQPGDESPWPFSFSGEVTPRNRADCWITRTNPVTHDIIRENLDRSPLYSGKIKSIGPRYCPSIEDKVVKFGERETHTLFLEPEGLSTSEMYLNGLSSSLPLEVQTRMVRSVQGLERAEILRPGYGIEYDYFDPMQLKATLESKVVRGLFFAGQINGTSGYEEAACQGLIAGINAAESILGGEALVLPRCLAYTGVLIDDLVTRGTGEPYRMFTSRAEYRILLRQDTADERLMPVAFERGLIGAELYCARRKKWEKKAYWHKELAGRRIDPETWPELGLHQPARAREILQRPEVTIDQIESRCGIDIGDREVRLGLEGDVKYEGFAAKQAAAIERIRGSEEWRIPEDIDYTIIGGLLTESRDKLARIRPQTVGQAGRIQGVTPADITVLLAYLGRRDHDRNIVSRETVDL